MISWGFSEPCNVSSLRTVVSVIEPGPWWPATPMRLTAEMSNAPAPSCGTPAAPGGEKPAPPTSAPRTQLIAATVGPSPDTARYSSVASTRRST